MTPQVCMRCRNLVAPKRQKPGSATVEFFLWTTLFFPGIAYTYWRIRAAKWICPLCACESLVTPESQTGQQLLGFKVSAVRPPEQR